MVHSFLLRTCSIVLLLQATIGLAMVTAAETEPKSSEPALPARLYEARGTERRQLDRFFRYLDQQQWDDALESAARLLQSDSKTVVAVGEHRFVSTRELVHQKLAQLPATILAEYRELVDAPAEAWYWQGRAERNPRLLRRVVDEMFCSSWGDQSLLALGELALERGESQAARRYWHQLSPEFFSPKQQTTLAYPDTDLKLAGIRARLALVSLYAGDLPRAQEEITALKIHHSTARGRLAGREVVYAEALTELHQQAATWEQQPSRRAWPTYAGSPQRTNASQPVGQTSFKKLWSQPLGDSSAGRRNTFPVVLDELVLVQTDSKVQALQLASGESVFAAQGTSFQSSVPKKEGLGSSSHTLSISDHFLFGITETRLNKQRPTNEPRKTASLWGIDLQRDGAVSFQQPSKEKNVIFAGTPILAGDRLWASVHRTGRTAGAGIVCFDLATREQLWQSWICQVDSPATGRANTLADNLLTYDAGIIYACTNLGAISASRADEGQPLWITTYERTNTAADSSTIQAPNPCVFARGLLFVLPTDGQELLALDAATGSVRWRRPRLDPLTQIVGITGNRLIISDHGLRSLDLQTGEPLVHNAKLSWFGMPTIVGETVYWPSDQAIQIVDLATGVIAEPHLQLPESGGANLLVTDGHLVAAGPSRITVYQAQPVAAEPPQILQLP